VISNKEEIIKPLKEAEKLRESIGTQ